MILSNVFCNVSSYLSLHSSTLQVLILGEERFLRILEFQLQMSSSQTQAGNTVWTSGCANTKILTYITGEVIYKVVDKWLKTFFHYSNGKEGESYRKKSTIIINDSDDKF